MRDELSGRIVVLGCAADEIQAPRTARDGGGKVRAAAAGACDVLDALLYTHPEFINTVWGKSRWLRREQPRLVSPRSLRPGEGQQAGDMIRAALQPSAAEPGDIVIERIDSEGDVEEGCRTVTRSIPSCSSTTSRRGSGPAPGCTSPSRAPNGARWAYSTRASVATRHGRRGERSHAQRRSYRGGLSAATPVRDRFREHHAARAGALIGVGRNAGWAFDTEKARGSSPPRRV